jgi:hypothetical protein
MRIFAIFTLLALAALFLTGCCCWHCCSNTQLDNTQFTPAGQALAEQAAA